MPKRVLEFLGLLTVILAIAVFITGKTDVKSFFEHVTFINFLITFFKTIVAYLLIPIIVSSSIFIIFDFPLLLFGIHFPVANFLWGILFKKVIIDWWWNASISQNIFLAITLIYLISRYQIETKKFKITIFFISAQGKWYHGFNFTIISIKKNLTNEEMRNSLTLGFLIIEKKIKITPNEPSAEQCGRVPKAGIHQTYKR